MGKIFVRLFLIIPLILYTTLIWMQSSYFNPESIYNLLSEVREEIPILAGIVFELFHFFQFGILYLLLIFVFLILESLRKELRL